MNNAVKYAAAFYYEWHPTKEGIYAIHVTFPDLLEAGLPYSTVGNNKADAIAAAKEILELAVEYATSWAIQLPDVTPIEKVNIDRGFDDLESYRIEVEYIAL